MKITCESCGARHDLTPPAWVVSSGRSFRFRCSACGSSQSVRPGETDPDAAPTEVPAARAILPQPTPPEVPTAEALRTEAPRTETPRTETPRTETLRTEALRTETPRTETPRATAPRTETPHASTARAETQRAETQRTETPRTETPRTETPDVPEPQQSPAPTPRSTPRAHGARSHAPHAKTPAGYNSGAVTVLRTTAPAPAPAAAQEPAPPPAPAPLPEGNPVYLKQSGQIYSVRDWATLRRWIAERRVDRNDLVSDGGVRWEPIGTHPTLAPLFASEAGASQPQSSTSQASTGAPTPPASLARTMSVSPSSPTSAPAPAPSSPPLPAPPPPPSLGVITGQLSRSFPYEDTPFGAPTSSDVWTDEDTEGIPLGLPPLPTEDDAPRLRKQDQASQLVAMSESEPAPDLEPIVVSPDPADETQLLTRAQREDTPALSVDGGLSFAEVRYEPTEEFRAVQDEREGDALAGDEFDAMLPPPSMKVGRGVVSRKKPSRPSEISTAPVSTAQLSNELRERASRPPADPARTGPTGKFRPSTRTGRSPDSLSPEDPTTPVRSSAQTSPARSRTPAAEPKPVRADALQTVTLKLDRHEVQTEPLQLSASDTGESGEFPFDSEWDTEHRPSSARWMWGGAVALTVALLALVGFWFGPSWFAAPTPEPQAVAPVPVVVPAVVPGTEPVPAPPQPEQAAPSKVPAPPQPEAEAAAEPQPAKPLPTPSANAGHAVKRGWEAADRDQWLVAERWFRRALDAAPEDEEAKHGYGYALLMQGKSREAATFLCPLRKSRSEDTRREIESFIEHRGLPCK
jgi:hypothetical protein